MWGRDRDPAARELVASCEAFVNGRYAELLIEHERAVPVWAWVNRLAHGTDSQLRETVTIGGARVPAAMV
jgi:hypothetical protein